MFAQVNRVLLTGDIPELAERENGETAGNSSAIRGHFRFESERGARVHDKRGMGRGIRAGDESMEREGLEELVGERTSLSHNSRTVVSRRARDSLESRSSNDEASRAEEPERSSARTGKETCRGDIFWTSLGFTGGHIQEGQGADRRQAGNVGKESGRGEGGRGEGILGEESNWGTNGL